MDFREKARQLVAEMTLSEKAELCSGADFWLLKSIPPLGLETIMVADGPNGLRKQVGETDHIGLNTSVQATCFPTSCALACSFDPVLAREVGMAVGEEALDQSISVVLGPGVNIKRSPLCGRNFEYFSEDPLLAGELGAAWVEGVQSQGVGTSLKHFACNNQETRRMCVNAAVDERALREIYLAPFERVVKKAQPWTVMTAYNGINGKYGSENRRLATEILRDEWGFQGAVVTDWGGLCDAVSAVRAGVNLEMPGTGPCHPAEIIDAVQSGTLEEGQLDESVQKIAELILKAHTLRRPTQPVDYRVHHALSVRAFEASAVLLRNNGNLLPAKKGQSTAVIGAFARMPRIQGAGSSKVNPRQVDVPLDAFSAAGVSFAYAPGYSLERGAGTDPQLIAQAVELAAGKEQVFLFAGLPEEYESEGYDRESMAMPESQLALIDAVAAVNPNVTVILMCGGPVELPFAERVGAILLCYLGGEGVGTGIVNLLYGKAVPSGKLAETLPLALEDTPAYPFFPGEGKQSEYRESIYVGYRYYATVGKAVRYPFGFGLSYTTFGYSDLSVVCTQDGDAQVRFTVENTGTAAGREVAQVYVGRRAGAVGYAARQLAGFVSVELDPGQKKELVVSVDKRSFQYYHTSAAAWCTEGGAYTIYVGGSSADTPLECTISLAGEGPEPQEEPVAYRNLTNGLHVTQQDFSALCGGAIPCVSHIPGAPMSVQDTLGDYALLPQNRPVIERLRSLAFAASHNSRDLELMTEKTFDYMPLRTLSLMLGAAATPQRVKELWKAFNASDLPAAMAIVEDLEAEVLGQAQESRKREISVDLQNEPGKRSVEQ